MKLYNFLNESIPYSKSTQKDLDDRIWAADEKRKRKLKKDPPKDPPKEKTESYYSEDPKPEQDIVDKFAGVSDKLRSYYIQKWAEKNGMKSDDAMFKAGYVHDGYIGAGAWNWRYVGMDESIQEAEEGMIGEPDSYYDAEDRTEAYNELQDALQGNYMDDYIKDGDCPACGGSGYMDGEETFTNDDGEEEESSECDGFGNYGCDEGEMTYGSDGPSWVEIIKHDERQAGKANRGPAPSEEQIMKILPRLHDDYVKSGRYNAFELPSILRQMYPELGKRQASSYVADFFSTFSESTIHESNKGEGEVAKMLSKALGDENRWTEMSPYELFAELESQNPEVADMLAKVAKQLYDVKLKERTYKDVGVADVVKDKHRGKEFKFNKDTKTFQSGDGEEASVNTPLGKELMKSRKSQMRKSTPSAHKKKEPKRPSLISQIFGK